MWQFIDSKDAPVAGEFDFPSLVLTDYDIVQVVLSGMKIATAPGNIGLLVYIGGVLKTTDYDFFQVGRHHGSVTNDPEAATVSMRLHTQTSDFKRLAGGAKHIFGAKVFIANPTVAVAKPWWSTAQYHAYGTDGVDSSLIAAYGGGVLAETGNIDGIKVVASAGGLTAGKVVLLGLNPT